VIRKSYTAAKVQGTGKVLISGVADLDSDSATVLVAHDASVKTTEGNLQHHYRWNVDLVKVGNKWLVDNFAPVN
jgi:Mce-associated membrane protein